GPRRRGYDSEHTHRLSPSRGRQHGAACAVSLQREFHLWSQCIEQRASLTGQGVLIGFVATELAGNAFVEPVAMSPKPAVFGHGNSRGSKFALFYMPSSSCSKGPYSPLGVGLRAQTGTSVTPRGVRLVTGVTA